MRHALVLALVTLVALPALADTTATIKFTSGAGAKGGMTMDGRWYLKGKRVRTEMQGPVAMVTIVDTEAKKLYALQEATKTYTEASLDQGTRDGADVAACSEGDVEGCLAKQGFRKTGTGEANGFRCELWTRTKDGKATLYRAPKRTAMQLVRMTFEGAQGGGQIDVVDVKEGPLDDALFTVPAGWTKSGGAMGLPGRHQRTMPSREEIERLMKQYGAGGQVPPAAPHQ